VEIYGCPGNYNCPIITRVKNFEAR